MSTIDLLTRVNGVIKKYEKYDTDNIRGPEIASHDYFLRLYKSIEDDLNGALKVNVYPNQLLTSYTQEC